MNNQQLDYNQQLGGDKLSTDFSFGTVTNCYRLTKKNNEILVSSMNGALMEVCIFARSWKTL